MGAYRDAQGGKREEVPRINSPLHGHQPCASDLYEKGAFSLLPARDGGAEWQVYDCFRTDLDILSHLWQHAQMYMECHISGSEVIHNPCLIGETRQTPERKSPVWKETKAHRSLDLEAGLGENGKDYT